jgi:hypothetical protein
MWGINNMGISEDQITAVGLLSVALALGLGLLFLLVLLARQVWRWATGERLQNSQVQGTPSKQQPGSEEAGIRSSLLASGNRV